MKPLLFTTFTLLACTLFAQKAARNPLTAVPRLSIYNIHGDTANLKDISNHKVTFIDFWFIPCGGCFAEMGMLHKLYDKYKNNPGVSFLTITLTDSAFVRPLLENRNTEQNETYTYFKSLAGMDTFSLPVYFIQNVVMKQLSLKRANGESNGFKKPKNGVDFIGKADQGSTKNSAADPDKVFGFSYYPTIFIFDRSGKRIYTKTGFTKEGERVQQNTIENIIDANL